MGDYISRQKVLDVIHGYFDGMLETDTWSPCDVYGLIEILPSADVQPVIRCKDCDSAECSGVMIYCLTHGCYMRDNDFCNYGEWKDGDTDG